MRAMLVRQGTAYPEKYSVALRRQLSERADIGVVIELTDQKPTDFGPLRRGWPGYWSKIEIFAPWNAWARPFLYIDLDSFVLGSLDHLDKGGEPAMVEDFNNWTDGNSCVMWVPDHEICDRIFSEFDASPEKHMEECGGYGDQKFIARYIGNRFSESDGILSYKRDCRAAAPADGASIVQFHGRPKPHEITSGWARAWWEKFNA